MRVALRPVTTAGIAVVGAGVLVAAPTIEPAPAPPPAAQSVAVEPASLVTDPIGSIGILLNAAGTTAALVADFIVRTMPTNMSHLIGGIIASPADTPRVLSWMLHCMLLPEPYVEYNNEITIMYRLTGPTVDALAQVLPAPLGSESGLVVAAFTMFRDTIRFLLSLLPPALIPGETTPAPVPVPVPQPDPDPGPQESADPPVVSSVAADVSNAALDDGGAEALVASSADESATDDSDVPAAVDADDSEDPAEPTDEAVDEGESHDDAGIDDAVGDYDAVVEEAAGDGAGASPINEAPPSGDGDGDSTADADPVDNGDATGTDSATAAEATAPETTAPETAATAPD